MEKLIGLNDTLQLTLNQIQPQYLLQWHFDNNCCLYRSDISPLGVVTVAAENSKSSKDS